jgi:hypothetical protein
MMACFRPDGPCGKGIPAEQPRVTLTGGRGFSVLLQQNLNHYNPGHAGTLCFLSPLGAWHVVV